MKKPRKVIVMFEIETDLTLKQIRETHAAEAGQTHKVPEGYAKILQVQVNLVKPTKASK